MIMMSARVVLPCRSIVTMSSAFASSRQARTVCTNDPASGSIEPFTGGGGKATASRDIVGISASILLQNRAKPAYFKHGVNWRIFQLPGMHESADRSSGHDFSHESAATLKQYLNGTKLTARLAEQVPDERSRVQIGVVE